MKNTIDSKILELIKETIKQNTPHTETGIALIFLTELKKKNLLECFVKNVEGENVFSAITNYFNIAVEELNQEKIKPKRHLTLVKCQNNN